MLFGTVPTSIPEIILFSNWVFEGNYKEKWNTLKGHKLFWILSSVFLMHWVGLIFTSNLEEGLHDIKIKIPLMLLPLVFFSAKPLNKKELNLLLCLLVSGIVLSSFWCVYYSYSHVLLDIRKASRFISHIRFGLFINLGICTLVYFIMEQNSFRIKALSVFIILYLLWFMLAFSFVTGLVMFGLLAVIFVLYLIIKQSVKIKLIGFSLLVAGALTGLWFIHGEWKASNFIDTSTVNTLKQKSLNGRPYAKVKDNKHTENGFYVGYNIQYQELSSGWPLLSKLSIIQKDKKNNPVVWTLIRYMTSKGLTKDSVGLMQLNKTDVENIEKGITNYKYADASALRKRVKEFLWEYQDYKNGANPSGNTMLMRFEFWKAAAYIIHRNIWMGVGTGDAQKAFDKAYYRTNTNLSHEWRLRSHNQFLAITVAFGIFGLMIFLFSLFYPITILRKKLHGLYFMFFIITIISFLTEDTLETQAGASFYAYFNTLFLWLAYQGRGSDELARASHEG
ncbi:MAG TPA: O-antigen ligase family protein [Bacteroidia bacterium]|nr:O-antigen ligase family protein [Bacteroidia bacterium]